MKYDIILLILLCCFSCDVESVPIQLHKKPKIGDVCIINNSKPVFVRSVDVSKSILKYGVVGVVYGIDNNKALIVNLDTRQPTTWSSALRFNINSQVIPKATGTFWVTLLNRTLNIPFSYHRITGSPEEFSNQLNRWFINNRIGNWSSYSDGNDSYIQYVGTFGDSSGYDFKLNDISFPRSLGSELRIENTYFCYNTIGQGSLICGMNRKRMEYHCKNNMSSVCAPKDNSNVDGENTLYDILPFSINSYKRSRKLTRRFSSYSDYLNACMIDIRKSQINASPLKYESGRLFTEILAKVTIPHDGKRIPLYPAAHFASNYKSPNKKEDDSLNWWLPSMYELAILFMNVEKVNKTLEKIPQWMRVDDSFFCWSSCPQSSYYAWLYHTSGMSDCNSMGWVDNSGKPFVKAVPVTMVLF